MKIQIFFDMDECLVNLSKEVVRQYNEDFNDSFDYKLNNHYWWGGCSKANRSYFEDVLNRQGTFLNAEPTENSIEMVTKLHEEGFNIHILTMPHWTSAYCVQEKIQWIQQYLPFIDVSKNVHFTGSKGLLAKENRILIDDNAGHLKSWRNQNGTAIAFGYFGWNEEWNGLRYDNFEDIYKSIHFFEDLKHGEIDKYFCQIDTNKFREYYNCKLNKEGEV